jgi:1-acyl-sn-glycerol-3-phosphate acyltransferase
MPRSVARSRALFALLALVHAATLFAAGAIVSAIFAPSSIATGRPNPTSLMVLIAVVMIVIRVFVLAQMPAIVRNAHWQLLRPLTCWELAGMAGALLGAAAAPGLMVGWPIFLIASALICPVAILAARGGANPLPEAPDRFFLISRGHIGDWSARRHLAASVVLAGLASALLSLMLGQQPITSESLPSWAIALLSGTVLGLALNLPQINSVRGLGLVGPAFFMLVVAALGHAFAPAAVWPAALLGLAMGLPLASLATGLLLHVLPRHRFAALLLADVGAGIAAAGGFAISRVIHSGVADWLIVVLAISAFGLFLKLYFREFAETIHEIAFWPLYRFDIRGPGRWSVPTRGPTLTIANHAAYFDPLFLCKGLPLSRIRAMMISTFLDRRFLKWLAGDVYEAIRVPENAGFRRQAPELDDAIAALKNGQHVMIFPEAWLRRKEEQPIRRFAQGVYRILSAVPDTVVIPCWIETSWGSYLSYKGGPPTRNKKFDVWFKIAYAIGDPVVLSRELLEDQIATRRHLMELVVNARTYLGLPAHPLPPFGSKEDEDKADHAHLPEHGPESEPEAKPG